MRKILIPLVCFFFAIHQIDALAQTYAAGACSQIPGTQSCVDSTPCKTDSSGQTICLAGVAAPKGALSVTQSCWQYNYQYSCVDSSLSYNSCTTASWYNPQTCSLTSKTCANTDTSSGACTSYNESYSCVTQAASTSQQTVCSNNLSSTAFVLPTNTNNTLIKAATAMEIARESQVYSSNGVGPIFVGTQETCRKGYFGLQNCCNSSPAGGSSNSAVMSAVFTVGSKVVTYAGQNAVDAASPYVFDALYSGGTYAAGLTNSLDTVSSWVGSSTANFLGNGASTGTNLAANGIGAYGFTYGSSTQVVGGGLGGGNIALSGGDAYQAAMENYQTLSEAYSEAVEAGTETVEGLQAVTEAGTALNAAASNVLLFNPYTFAASVVLQFAIQAIMAAMACTQEEQMLALHRGANLSVFTGETCTNKIPIIGTCLQYTDTYCSFNSVLALIINQQGKAQLGLNFSDCSGLTIAQIGQLNFATMDFSQFSAQMMQQALAGAPASANIASSYQPLMNAATQGSSQSPTTGLAYPSK